jgi:Mce-associated membrane protein
VQDQQPDSSDLTTDEAATLVPEGKANRRRHRMPRQSLRHAAAAEAEAQVEDSDDAVTPDAERDASVTPETDPETDAEPETEAEPETGAELEAEPEPVAKRSRFSWRRAKPAEPLAAEDEGESDGAESDGETTESKPDEYVLVPHRTAGRRLKIAALAAGALFVAASAFAGATLQPYLSDRAEVQVKLDVARTAQAAITTLWTYTPQDMDKLQQRAARYLGGDFAADYKNYITGIVEANKQAQISNSTQVLGVAVESLTPTDASAIIYTNSVATSPVTKGIPSLRYLSYRLQMQRHGGEWLITKMTAVTSLDLTPRL